MSAPTRAGSAAARALVLVSGLALSVGAAAQVADIERGRRLFNGELPLTGTVSGHTTALPPQASRCINCHAPGSAPPPTPPNASAGSGPTPSFGPALNAKLLLQDTRRRGGPPSRYDEAALCKLLSTGIDPAYIIIPASMPRYQMTSSDCSALWAFLTQPGR